MASDGEAGLVDVAHFLFRDTKVRNRFRPCKNTGLDGTQNPLPGSARPAFKAGRRQYSYMSIFECVFFYRETGKIGRF